MSEVDHADAYLQPSAGDMVDLVLEPQAASVTTGRHAVERLLEDARLTPSELAEDVLLLVSELIANAVLHARTPMRLRASAADGRVTVAVEDDDPLHAPCPSDRGTQAISGRGMRLVDLLASSWGVEVGKRSKVVWFETTFHPGALELHPA